MQILGDSAEKPYICIIYPFLVMLDFTNEQLDAFPGVKKMGCKQKEGQLSATYQQKEKNMCVSTTISL